MIEGLSESEQCVADDLLQRMVDNVSSLLGEECEGRRG